MKLGEKTSKERIKEKNILFFFLSYSSLFCLGSALPGRRSVFFRPRSVTFDHFHLVFGPTQSFSFFFSHVQSFGSTFISFSTSFSHCDHIYEFLVRSNNFCHFRPFFVMFSPFLAPFGLNQPRSALFHPSLSPIRHPKAILSPNSASVSPSKAQFGPYIATPSSH